MKVLVYGSKGWIGGMFMDFLKNIQDIVAIEGVSRVDCTEELEIEIKTLKPTHVISFIGRTYGYINDKLINSIDYLEYPNKLVENVRDNLFSPLVLAELSKIYNYHYSYLGTGCIFNGEGFTEESIPNYFGSSYSVVKGFTDRLLHFHDVLNLRIRMPISYIPNKRDFITKITNYSYICSIPNSMTVLEDFFPIFLDLMIKKKIGTYNCTNPGVISHNEILTEYKNLVDNSFTWNNMTIEEQSKKLLSDRSNNHLDTTLIETEYPELPTIKESVHNVLISFQKLGQSRNY